MKNKLMYTEVLELNKECLRERFRNAIDETNVNIDNSMCKDQLLDNLMKCFNEEGK